MAYAKGKYAVGISDRSGFKYKLKDLVYEYVDGKPTGLRVGRDEVDKDHPQNRTGEIRTDDPRPLYDPRPDDFGDRGLFGFGSVGNPEMYLRLSTATVTVSITGFVEPVEQWSADSDSVTADSTDHTADAGVDFEFGPFLADSADITADSEDYTADGASDT